MGIISYLKGLWNRLTNKFAEKAVEEFGAPILLSGAMLEAMRLWEQMYLKNPPWAKKKIKTIGFAKSISSETARLACLEIEATVGGSPRAEYLNEQLKGIMKNIRKYTEYMCAYSYIVAIPNGIGLDVVKSTHFLPTSFAPDGTMDGGYGFDFETIGENFYTRIIYLRYVDDYFAITNRAFVSRNQNDIGKAATLSSVSRWAEIEPDIYFINADGTRPEKPYFAAATLPMANGVDPDVPIGAAVFADAVEEIKDLDVAYSINSREIKNSGKIILLGDTLINEPGARINSSIKAADYDLPEYVKILPGAQGDEYHEINPQLNTEERLKGINSFLSFIGYKCGYSNGYFSFDQARGLMTATQVEAEDKRTIEMIDDIRDKSIKPFIEHCVWILDKLTSLNTTVPLGEWEVSFYFKDITVSFSEDRQRYLQLAREGRFPWKKYYVEYEGYSEKEAEELMEELKAEQEEDLTLFNEE